VIYKNQQWSGTATPDEIPGETHLY